jgi:hypothetical protein
MRPGRPDQPPSHRLYRPNAEQVAQPSARMPARPNTASTLAAPPTRPGGGAPHSSANQLVANLAGRTQARLSRLEHRADASSWVPAPVVRAVEVTRKLAEAIAEVSARMAAPPAPGPGPSSAAGGAATASAQPTRALQEADPLHRLAWVYTEHAALLKAQAQYRVALSAGRDPSDAFKAEWNSQVNPEIWAHHAQAHYQEIVKTVTEMARVDAERVAHERVAQAGSEALTSGYNPSLAEETELNHQLTTRVLEQTFRQCYADAVRVMTEAALGLGESPPSP